jgi:fumarate reductase subunit D
MKKKYIRSNEPVVWGLFGAGGMVAAFLLPVLILVTGILVPLGIVDDNVLSYQRVLTFSEHWLGKILLLITISLSMWHGIHRFYHGLHDFGQENHRRLTFFLCYGFALLITVLTALLLLS